MKLIVGLGNPGKQYEYTRHNCGFLAIDYYASKNGLSFKSKFNGLYAEHIINGEKFIFLKPQTFMNLSGECVVKFVNYYNININDVLIIYDDVNFEVGTFKIRRGGSSGGHNGINNIISNLKTENIARVRMGISKNNISLMDYVLCRFPKDDMEKINSVLPKVEDVINDFQNFNVDKLMERYNGIFNEK